MNNFMDNKLALFGGKPALKKSLKIYNSIGPEEKKAVARVMDKKVLSDFIGHWGNKFLGGIEVKTFEKMMCAKFKVKYAVSFNSASTALQAAVTALGIGPGDEVITSPFTMCATPAAVLLNNAIPVFADIDKNNYCLDYRSVEKNITKKTKAIFTVNLFGGSSDFDKLLPLAKKYNLKLIEDNAQSIGAKYKNKFLGTIGDVGVFSFNVHKHVQCGEGGVLVTNNKKIALRAQLVRNHGDVVSDDLFINEKIYEPIIGNNFRLSELHAAVAIEQLKKVNQLNKPRIDLANYLTKKLEKYSWLQPPAVLKGTTHVYYVYPFNFYKNKIGFSRKTFALAMAKEGFTISEGYTKPLYLTQIYQRKRIYPHSQFPFISKEYRSTVKYKKGICPNAESLYEQEIVFANICYPPITKKEIDLFVLAIDKIDKNAKALIAYEKKNK